jgi:hypothetical protein
MKRVHREGRMTALPCVIASSRGRPEVVINSEVWYEALAAKGVVLGL